MKKIVEPLSKTGFNPSYQNLLQDLVRNPTISFKAKGLFLLIGDLPLEYRTFESILECSKKGSDSIRAGIKELEEAKLLYRLKCRKNGKIYKNYWVCWPVPFTSLQPQHIRELKELGLSLNNKGVLIHD